MSGNADAFVRGYDKARWELRLCDPQGTHSVVEMSRAADGVLRAEVLWTNRRGETIPAPRSTPVKHPTCIGVDMKGYREKRHLFRKTWDVVLWDDEGEATEVSLTRLKDGWFIAQPTMGREDSGSQG